jgi:molybdate transport system substrate-binding protein
MSTISAQLRQAQLRRGLPTVLAMTALLLAAVPAWPRTPQPAALTVLAAASLTDAFRALAAEYHRSTGADVRLSFGSSAALKTQIQQGAPADVFASADREQMEPLARAGLVAAPRVLAHNRLAVAVPAKGAKVRSVADLAKPGVRLVLAAPTAPAGRYADEMLRRLDGARGYQRGFAGRALANVVSREANVRAALAKVELGETDAAVVYATDAMASRKVRALPVPAMAQVRAVYLIAVVADSHNRQLAEGFVRLALSPHGQAALRRYGFQ